MLRNIVNEQVTLGHEIHLIVINDNLNKELHDSLHQHIVFHNMGRKEGSKNPLPFLQLNLLLRWIHPDVIHLHYSSIARFIFIPSLKEKMCVTQHDVCNATNSRFLYKNKRIYAISNTVQEDIRRRTGYRSEVVLNGIYVEQICNDTRERHGLFKIVQVSRLIHEKKGQHILIQAIARLVKEGYNQLQLDLIGDGNSREYLDNLTKQLGVTRYVRFLGAKEQSYIFKHLCEYDLYVQPSIYEGFGLTVTEAMAAKVPVLVSENQGPLEIIDNGRYGYSFKNQDIEDCADKIRLFLKGMNDASIVNKAYQRVLELYNVKVTAGTYLDKYKEFIESGYAKIY